MRLVFLLALTWSFAAVAQDNALHLLDSGEAVGVDSVRGGTAPPTGPTPIAYMGGGPGAMPVPPGFGFPGTAIPTALGSGGFVGNLFVPAIGYPASFLSAGGVPGFDVTGVFAWHLAPTTMASVVRILGVATMPPPPTPFAPSLPAVAVASAPISIGAPAPSAVVGGPGIFPPLRLTPSGTPATSGVFCGLVIGGPLFPPIGAGAGNGLGGDTLTPQPSPIRFMPGPPLATGVTAAPLPASPAAYIAGCFADSSTTPVELQAYEIE